MGQIGILQCDKCTMKRTALVKPINRLNAAAVGLFLFSMFDFLPGRHNGAVVSLPTARRFWIQLKPFSVEFVCSSHACMGFSNSPKTWRLATIGYFKETNRNKYFLKHAMREIPQCHLFHLYTQAMTSVMVSWW